MDTLLLTELFADFRRRFEQNPTLREWAEAEGLDTEHTPMGFNSGRFVGELDEVTTAAAKACGLVVEDRKGMPTSIGKKCLVFPLSLPLVPVSDLYFVPLQGKRGQYLFAAKGFYPACPPPEAPAVIIEPDIRSAAKRLQQERSLPVLALADGHLSRDLCAWAQEATATQLLLSRTLAPVQAARIAAAFATLGREVAMEDGEVVGPAATTVPDDQPLVERPSEGMTFDDCDPHHLILTCGGLTLEVFGGIDLQERSTLKVTLKASTVAHPLRGVRDTLNLFVHAQAEHFARIVTDRLALPFDHVRDALDRLIHQLETYRRARGSEQADRSAPIALSPAEEQQARDYLREGHLMERLSDDLGNVGLVGEVTNRMIAFLVSVSRKLAQPLHLVSYGRTGSGKSSLLDAVAACTPPEDVLELTSASERAFYHVAEQGLSGKLLAIQDLTGLSEGVQFQLRELQSKQKLIRPITIKDKNGAFRTIMKTVLGPVTVMLSTTRASIYQDNANRSIELLVDESPEQDELVLRRQRALAAGTVDLMTEEATRERLRSIQRILQPCVIKNPFANELGLPAEVLSKRRTNTLYLGLIQTITFLHQYQRKPVTGSGDQPCLLTTAEDIAWADRLFGEILLRKADLLTQATRGFFEDLKTWTGGQGLDEFTQRQLASGMRVHPARVKRSVHELMDYGFVTIIGGDRYRKGFSYRVADEGEFARLKERVLAARPVPQLRRKKE